MTIRSVLIAAAVAAAAIVGLAVAPGSDLPASAQTVTVPPTTPCEGCGPSNQPGDGVSAFAFPSHVCREMPDGYQFSDYWLTFGLGRNAPGPARFEWDNASIMGEQWVDLGWVQPGRTRHAGPLVTVAPGDTTTINVRAFDQAGNPVRFGDRSYRRTFVLTCPCDQPSPPSSVTPPPASTAPGTTVVPERWTMVMLAASCSQRSWAMSCSRSAARASPMRRRTASTAAVTARGRT